MGWRWKYRLPHRCLVRTIQWKVLLRWHCHHLCPNLKARITKKPGTTLWGFSTTVIKREIKAKPKLCKFGSVAKPQSCKYVQVSNPKTAAQRRCSKRRPRRICLAFCSRGWSHSALSLHLVWWRWRSFLSRSYTEWMIEYLNYTLNWSECILFIPFYIWISHYDYDYISVHWHTDLLALHLKRFALLFIYLVYIEPPPYVLQIFQRMQPQQWNSMIMVHEMIVSAHRSGFQRQQFNLITRKHTTQRVFLLLIRHERDGWKLIAITR